MAKKRRKKKSLLKMLFSPIEGVKKALERRSRVRAARDGA